MIESDLDVLCAELRAELARDPRGRRVVAMLERYASTSDDWRRFTTVSLERYTRNLVFRCADYELLLWCRKEGQVSPIHNHMGQSCWMAALDGEFEEVHYRLPEGADPDSLEAGQVRSHGKGAVASIEDSIARHLVRPAAGKSGVSLHLYASAIDECRVYDSETGELTLIALGYHSVRGESCADKSPEAIRSDL